MKKLITILLILIVKHISAQDSLNFKMNEIVVTSLHHPSILFDINKTIEVLPYQKIATAPVQGVIDYLNYSNSVSLDQRGINGVQSDISIRGGNYEQTLIMLDGIKIIDPQTGHHNLNLPVTSLNIEQIEIVKGNSSNINGANAFSGLVNFKTKRSRQNTFAGKLTGGDYSLYSVSLFGSYNLKNLSNNIAFEKNHSNGYRENTEYDITNFSYGMALSTSSAVVDVFLGYTDKSFGANSFYTSKYPLQFEHTKTTFAKASAEFGTGKINFSTKLYWRKNNDEFLLDKTNPDFYKNNHITNIYGAEAEAYITSSIGKTSVGSEFVVDNILSNNLGEHRRQRIGVFFEQTIPEYKQLQFSLSGFIYNYSEIGWKLWPGLSIGYSLNKQLKIFADYSNGFRIPTYTELFYNSPTIKGNSNLNYEETSNYELGMKYFNKHFSSTLSIFYKNGSNIIDWVLVSSDAPWQAMNIANLETTGMEFNLNLDFTTFNISLPLKNIEIKYTFLNSTYTTNNIKSKYLLNYLKNQLVFIIKHSTVLDINLNWYFRYQDRYNSAKTFITDLSVNKMFGQFNVFIKASNLFNSEHTDFIGIPLPGRWITGGVKIII